MVCPAVLQRIWGSKHLQLAVGALIATPLGFSLAFNSWQNLLKDSLELSQTQVSFVGSTLNLGMESVLFGGLFLERFGNWRSGVLALLTTLLSHSAIFILLQFPAQLSGSLSALLFVSFYVMGLAISIGYIQSMSVSVYNYKSAYGGRALSVIGVSFKGATSIFSAISSQVKNIKTLFAGFMVWQLLISLAATLFQRYVDSRTHGVLDNINDVTEIETKEDGDNEATSKTGSNEETTLITNRSKYTWFDRINYILLIVTCGLGVAASKTVFYNVGILLRSFHHEDYVVPLTVSGPIIGIITKVLFGVLSDVLVHRVPRIVHIILVTGIQSISLLLFVCAGDNIVVLFILILTNFGVYTVVLVVTQSIIAEWFELRHFPRLAGLMLFIGGILTFLTQILFGFLYDGQVSNWQSGNRTCYGDHCFTTISLLLFATSTIAFILSVTLWVRTRRK